MHPLRREANLYFREAVLVWTRRPGLNTGILELSLTGPFPIPSRNSS